MLRTRRLAQGGIFSARRSAIHPLDLRDRRDHHQFHDVLRSGRGHQRGRSMRCTVHAFRSWMETSIVGLVDALRRWRDADAFIHCLSSLRGRPRAPVIIRRGGYQTNGAATSSIAGTIASGPAASSRAGGCRCAWARCPGSPPSSAVPRTPSVCAWPQLALQRSSCQRGASTASCAIRERGHSVSASPSVRVKCSPMQAWMVLRAFSDITGTRHGHHEGGAGGASAMHREDGVVHGARQPRSSALMMMRRPINDRPGP